MIASSLEPQPPVVPGVARAAFRAPRPWILLCLVVIVVITSYLPVLGAPFVWDDHHLIDDSPLIQELHPLRDYFGQSFWQTDDLGQGRTYYRPLTILSLAVDHEFYGDEAGGYHLSNLLVHLLSTTMLFRLLRVRGASGHAAAFGAALWSLHPRLTEAVAWVSGRTDVLAGFFVLAALLVQSRPGVTGRLGAACLLFLGLLCKEVALAGVAAVLVLESSAPGSFLERARRAVPTLLGLGLYLLLRGHASGVTAPRSVSIVTLGRRASAAVGHYFVMVLCPWLPNVQIGQLAAPRAVYVVLGCVVLALLGALLLRFRRRLNAGSWSALTLSAVGLGMVLHIVPFSINVIAADRFLYLPLVGAALLLTPALSSWVQRRLLAGICGLLSLSFAIATCVRADAWADEVTLWTRTYKDNPENEFLACAELGRLYVRAGLFAQAYSLYRGCSVTPVRRFVLLSNAASVLARTGRYREALGLLDGLGELARRTPLVALNQALFNTYLNDFAAARAALARALSADPKSENGRALLQQLPTIEQARQELAALPDDAPALERAHLSRSLGLIAEGVQAWQVALAHGSLSRDQFREGVGFVLSQGDAASIRALHQQYLAYFEQAESSPLERAYRARDELSQRLLALWPQLGVQLLGWPGTARS